MRWFVAAAACAAAASPVVLVRPAAAAAQGRAESPAAAPDPNRDAAAGVLAEPLTLDRAIRVGLENQNQLAIAASQVGASRERVTQARASLYPSIAPSFDYNNQRTSARTGNGTRTNSVEQSVTSIGLRQTLFDMGKRQQSVAANRDSLRASEFNLLDTRQAIILNITANWYELRRRRDLVRVAESSAERARTTLEATRAFVEAETAPRKDIFQAQADYDNALVQVIQARNAVLLSESSLKSAMGVLTTQRVNVPETALDKPAADPDTRPITEYVSLAYERRPDLKREAANIDVSRRNVKLANIEAGVQVQADVTEGYRLNPDPGENRVFGTSISYPLFDAGASRARVREAKAGEYQAKQQNELTRQGIQVEVEQSFLSREEARSRIGATEAAVQAARVNYEAATEAQKEGAGDILSVITAQNQLVTAETNAVQAIYDFYDADARLRRAVGDNDPYLNDAAPGDSPAGDADGAAAKTTATKTKPGDKPS